MRDVDCVDFLRWALPTLQLRWPGFRKVRRQVCRRIDRRRAELALEDVAAYRRHLEAHAGEWGELDRLCRVTISRFGRDRGVWQYLAADLLPGRAAAATAEGRPEVTAWSAGCGAGEEPYTLAMAWRFAVAPRWPEVGLSVLATDIDELQLERARVACYPPGSLRELPDSWREAAFVARDGQLCVHESLRRQIRFAVQDVRSPPPAGRFDLILCRNLAFTYFAEPVQLTVADRLRSVLHPGGLLVVGIHERIPEGAAGLQPRGRCVYTT